jgi:beta-lactamase class A
VRSEDTQPASARALTAGIERTAAGVRAEWGVYVKLLRDGTEIALNADVPMDTMSVVKLPLLLELHRQADEGLVDLHQRIALRPEHRRFGTGVLSLLDDGLELTLGDAATLMIVQSDNAATDICFAAVGGPAAVNALMDSLALASIEVTGTAFDWFSALAGSMDAARGALGPAELFAAGYPALAPDELARRRAAFHFGGGPPFSLGSARDLGRLLELCLLGEAASRAACERVMSTLRLQQHRSRIPRYLIEAQCAHKTGDFEPFIANDVGVIEPNGSQPAIVVFLNARHAGLWENLEDAVARMAQLVWLHAVTG